MAWGIENEDIILKVESLQEKDYKALINLCQEKDGMICQNLSKTMEKLGL